MQFGFHRQMNNWNRQLSYSSLLEDLREQAKFVDDSGFDAIWLAEHHLGPEGLSNSPNPILVGADIAAHTKRVQIGMSCVTVTVWNPIRLAEDLAILDHMSKGRLEVGFGRGGFHRDTAIFNMNADPRNETISRELMYENIDIILKAWTNEFFSHQGPNYLIPPPNIPHHTFSATEREHVTDGDITKICVVPKPYQQPHPPLWMMVSSEKSVRYAAENGMNAMSAGLSTDTLSELVDIYAQIRTQKEGREYQRGECWAVSRPAHVAVTMEQARKNFEEPLLRQHNYQAHYRDDPQAFLKTIYGNPNEQSDSNIEITWQFLLERSSFAGSPEDVIEQIANLQEKTGIGYISCYMDPGGIPHKDIMSSIELFASNVIPAFK